MGWNLFLTAFDALVGFMLSYLASAVLITKAGRTVKEPAPFTLVVQVTIVINFRSYVISYGVQQLIEHCPDFVLPPFLMCASPRR